MTTTATGHSVTVPASWNSLTELMETPHRLVTTWKDDGPDFRTVTNLVDGDMARGVFDTLADAGEVAEVLWQTRSQTGRPRFRAVMGVISTTLPL